MIRIYILEDDPSIIHNLTQIITSEKLGIICGDSADGMPSTAEILATRPDVIMLDFFMPQRDGIEVVTDLRAQGCTAKCIMLSQVSEKTLIGKASRDAESEPMIYMILDNRNYDLGIVFDWGSTRSTIFNLKDPDVIVSKMEKVRKNADSALDKYIATIEEVVE